VTDFEHASLAIAYCKSHDRCVSIVTRLQAWQPGCRGSILGRGKNISSFHSVQTGFRAHPHFWVVLYSGIKRSERQADHTALSRSELTNMWSLPPFLNMISCCGSYLSAGIFCIMNYALWSVTKILNEISKQWILYRRFHRNFNRSSVLCKASVPTLSVIAFILLASVALHSLIHFQKEEEEYVRLQCRTHTDRNENNSTTFNLYSL
jgi:hypothetical protein